MKTSELTGAQLDYWVARAEGLTLAPNGCDAWNVEGPEHHPARFRTICAAPSGPDFTSGYTGDWSPSTKWDDGGPIIERERIDIEFTDKPHKRPACCATINSPDDGTGVGYGATPLVAAMRAYVAARYGLEVQIG